MIPVNAQRDHWDCGCIPDGPVNSQRAQWGCRYIPVNAQGDQLDCTVSVGKPGVQRDCACVCMRDVGRLRVRSCTCYILNSYFIFHIQYKIYYTHSIQIYYFAIFYFLHSVILFLKKCCGNSFVERTFVESEFEQKYFCLPLPILNLIL